MKKAKTMFAIWDSDPGTLHIKAEDCGIPFMILLYDCVPLVYETNKRGKPTGKPYVRAEDVAAWHRKELKITRGASGSQLIADAIDLAIEKVKQGKVVENK